MRSVYVVQHTESEFLGLVEDHLEGRNIRFTYMRPFAAGGSLPATVEFTDALILLGGGPWSAAGPRVVPGLEAELRLVWRCFERGVPVVGFGLGAQILALAAGGRVEPGPLRLEVGEAHRVDDGALNGFLPARFAQASYMAGRPLPPDDARILARDESDRPAVFQIGAVHLGFSGHPGAKVGMVEDLAMEFDDAPADLADGLERLRGAQRAIADALVPIMTGLVQVTGLMRAR